MKKVKMSDWQEALWRESKRIEFANCIAFLDWYDVMAKAGFKRRYRKDLTGD